MALRAGRRRLLIAGVVGVALVGALVALQLVDDGGDTTGSDQALQVKGASAARPASLVGRIQGADGFSVEVLVVSLDGEVRATADPDGHYRVDDLAPGPVEVSWVGSTSSDAGGGISLGAQRSGHTQITLDAGRNRFDIEL